MKSWQRVGRQIAPLDPELNPPAVRRGSADGFHRRAALSEGFDHRKPARILQDRAGQIAVGGGLDGRVARAVMRDDHEAAKGQRRGQERSQRRERTERRQTDKYHEEIEIPVDEAVDHADPHVFQRIKAGRHGVQNIAGRGLLEIAQRHPPERVAHGQTVARGQLIADRLLAARPQIVEQKAQQHKRDLYDEALPDPACIERRAGFLRVDQQTHRVGRRPPARTFHRTRPRGQTP